MSLRSSHSGRVAGGLIIGTWPTTKQKNMHINKGCNKGTIKESWVKCLVSTYGL